MSALDSLQRILQEYATPVVTLQRPINEDVIYMTIAWGDCFYRMDVKDFVAKAMKDGDVTLTDIKRYVNLSLSGLAETIRGGTCSYCGSRKTSDCCERCGA